MANEKQNKPLTPEDILGSTERISVPVPTNTAPPAPPAVPLPAPVPTTTQQDIQNALAALQLKKLQKEVQAEEDDEQSKANARRQTAEKVAAAEANREANQNFCTHIKPNGRSALGGQKTHSTIRGLVYIFLCQYCQKEFNETNIPPHLRISAEQVGGPTQV